MWEKSEEGNENVDVFYKKKIFLTADLEEKDMCVYEYIFLPQPSSNPRDFW